MGVSPNVWPLQRDCLAYYGDPRQDGWLHTNTIDVACRGKSAALTAPFDAFDIRQVRPCRMFS
jgi:hypothetical protein